MYHVVSIAFSQIIRHMHDRATETDVKAFLYDSGFALCDMEIIAGPFETEADANIALSNYKLEKELWNECQKAKGRPFTCASFPSAHYVWNSSAGNTGRWRANYHSQDEPFFTGIMDIPRCGDVVATPKPYTHLTAKYENGKLTSFALSHGPSGDVSVPLSVSMRDSLALIKAKKSHDNAGVADSSFCFGKDEDEDPYARIMGLPVPFVDSFGRDEDEDPDARKIIDSAYKNFLRDNPHCGASLALPQYMEKIRSLVKLRVSTSIEQELRVDINTGRGAKIFKEWVSAVSIVLIHTAAKGTVTVRDADLAQAVDISIYTLLPFCERIHVLRFAANNGSLVSYELTDMGKILYHYIATRDKLWLNIMNPSTSSASSCPFTNKVMRLLAKAGYSCEKEVRSNGKRSPVVFDITAKKDGSTFFINCPTTLSSANHYRMFVNSVLSQSPLAVFVTPDEKLAADINKSLLSGLGSHIHLRNRGMDWVVISYKALKKQLSGDADCLLSKLRHLHSKKSSPVIPFSIN